MFHLWSSPLLSTRRWTRAGGVLLVLSLLLAAGCNSGSKNRVAGRVRLDGKLVHGGTVTFVGAGKEKKSTAISADGEYVIENPPQGTVRIGLRSAPGATLAASSSGPRATIGSGEPPTALPQRYEMYDNGLTFLVTEGEQHFDIDLTP